MTKLERNQIARRKWLARLRLYKIPVEDGRSGIAFRTTSRPCNCWVCRKEKYKRERLKVELD